MIGNCAVMGADWRTLGWLEYQIRLAGWNAAQAVDSEGPSPPDKERLKRFVEAHTVH